MGSTIAPPPPPDWIPRADIKVPLHLARGQYERLTDAEFLDHLKDLTADLERRLQAAHATP